MGRLRLTEHPVYGRSKRASAPPPKRWPLIATLVIVLGVLIAVPALALHTTTSRPIGAATPRPTAAEGVFLVTPSPVSGAAPSTSLVSPTPIPNGSVASVLDLTPTSLQVPAAIPTAGANESRFAFLLLGYGGGGHDGAYLTDSMMVVVVDPAGKTLTLLSVPRDSWVPLAFTGHTDVYNKINTAYAFAQDPTVFPNRLPRYDGAQGPGNFAMDTVSRLLGIPIRYYLGLDFQGFRDMINTVGGVEVDVPDGFSAHYPINDDPSINAGWMTVTFTAGPQHMDGERAIEYARARETIDNPNEGTDFARSRRQRLIMEAFKTRLFQPGGLIHLPQLLSIASQHVDTNYTVPDVAQLSQLILGWKSVKIYQTALTSSNYLEDGTGPDGTYITVPNSPDHSWAEVRAFARRVWQDPAAGVAMASTTVVVENDTGVPGVAGQVGDALASLGYQVGTPVVGPTRTQSLLVDPTATADAAFIHQLGQDLGRPDLAVATASPSEASAPVPAKTVVLHLGSDDVALTLKVPPDPTAPYSTVGVVKFGVWPYVPTAATATPAPEVRPIIPVPIADSPTPVHQAIVPTAEPSGTAKPTGLIVVPRLLGLPAASAQHLAEQTGLGATLIYQTLNDVSDHQFFFSVKPGFVLSQWPVPGKSVPRGTKISIAVRKS
jgi:LCP family protein required for cell wall assembly